LDKDQDTRWTVAITDANFGEKNIFYHTIRWMDLNPSYQGIGLTWEDFSMISLETSEKYPKEVMCTDDSCVAVTTCDEMKGKIPDITISIQNQI